MQYNREAPLIYNTVQVRGSPGMLCWVGALLWPSSLQARPSRAPAPILGAPHLPCFTCTATSEYNLKKRALARFTMRPSQPIPPPGLPLQCYLKDSHSRLLDELERARREVRSGAGCGRMRARGGVGRWTAQLEKRAPADT